MKTMPLRQRGQFSSNLKKIFPFLCFFVNSGGGGVLGSLGDEWKKAFLPRENCPNFFAPPFLFCSPSASFSTFLGPNRVLCAVFSSLPPVQKDEWPFLDPTKCIVFD